MPSANRSRKIIAAIVLGCGFLTVLAILVARQSRLDHGRKFAVRFALPAQYFPALLILADKAGYFDAYGIQSTLTFLPTGQDSLAAMFKGDADFAGVFETPVVHAALAGEKMEILTELHTSDDDAAIIYRKDRGIAQPEDLVGRKIAVVAKTNAQFMVDLFLRSHLIDSAKVSMIPESLDGLLRKLREGKVDAAGIWEPFISNLIAAEPQIFGRMDASFYTEFSVLVSKPDTVDHEQRNRNVVAAVIAARDFLRANPEKAHAIIEQVVNLHNLTSESSIWSKIRPRVGLSSTLLAMLSEEARWYQNQEGAGNKARIDFRAMLRPSYLKELAPRTVTYE